MNVVASQNTQADGPKGRKGDTLRGNKSAVNVQII